MEKTSGVGRTGAGPSAKNLQMGTNAMKIQSVWFPMWTILERENP